MKVREGNRIVGPDHEDLAEARESSGGNAHEIFAAGAAHHEGLKVTRGGICVLQPRAVSGGEGPEEVGPRAVGPRAVQPAQFLGSIGSTGSHDQQPMT